MRVMALDIGTKRIGVALSDEGRSLATPREVIAFTSFADLIAKLKHIVAEQQVTALLVGHPLSLNGAEGPQAQRVAKAAQRIRAGLQLPLTLWDERLTTVQAQALRPARRQRRAPLDHIAAALLLQDYLDAQQLAHEIVVEDQETHE